MAKVARVILNRLAKNMPLQLDSTVNYGMGADFLQLTNQQLQKDGPYNTYTRTGLPPTPINNPGAAAIEAALSPVRGDWLYFVTTDPKNKVTEFAVTAGGENSAARAISGADKVQRVRPGKTERGPQPPADHGGGAQGEDDPHPTKPERGESLPQPVELELGDPQEWQRTQAKRQHDLDAAQSGASQQRESQDEVKRAAGQEWGGETEGRGGSHAGAAAHPRLDMPGQAAEKGEFRQVAVDPHREADEKQHHDPRQPAQRRIVQKSERSTADPARERTERGIPCESAEVVHGADRQGIFTAAGTGQDGTCKRDRKSTRLNSSH